jgi:hypothetical protein
VSFVAGQNSISTNVKMSGRQIQPSIAAESSAQAELGLGVVDYIAEQMSGTHPGPLKEEGSGGQMSLCEKEDPEEKMLREDDKPPSQNEAQGLTHDESELQGNNESSPPTPSSASSTLSEHNVKLLEQEAMMRRITASTGVPIIISKMHGSVEEQDLVPSKQRGWGCLFHGSNPKDLPTLLTAQTPETRVKRISAERYAEAPIPDTSGLFDKELIGNFNPPNEYKTDWRVPTEPDTPLDENGLPDPHSCKHCAHLVFDGPMATGEKELLLSRSREHIATAADGRCPLFQWLEWHLYGDGREGPSQFSDISLRLTVYGIEGTWCDWDADEQGRRFKGQWGKFGCFTTSGKYICFFRLTCYDLRTKLCNVLLPVFCFFMSLTLTRSTDDPAAQYCDARPINLHVWSDKSFCMAKSWLEECIMLHRHCSPREVSRLPTRVLDVSKKSIVLYHSQQNERGLYAALSYCWGGNQTTKLTKGTLSNLEHEIPFVALPQTLQDAVAVTRRLNIQYLWIDSLCIIQDDPDDIAKEISQMYKIYFEACITLSAATAETSKEGFLQIRKPSKHRRHTLSLPIQPPDAELGKLYFYLIEYHNPKEEEPIHSRAWTLQEHLLSGRVLVFGSWQLRWICREMNDCDGGQKVIYHQALEHLSQRLFSPVTLDSLARLPEIDDEDVKKSRVGFMRDIFDLWPTLVHEYTRRHLTVKEDRVVAIAGLAELYARLIGGEYIAGHWLRSLSCSLLWRRPPFYEHTGFTARRQPSWAWTSVDGEVKMLDLVEFGSDNLDLIDYKFQLASPLAPFGDVLSAHLTVAGRVRSAFHFKGSRQLWFFDSENLEDNDPATTATATWDCAEDPSTEELTQFLCLEILPFRNDERVRDRDPGDVVRPAGLILQRKEGDNEGAILWERRGLFDFQWDNGLWLELYGAGSRDHNERRVLWRENIFNGLEKVLVTIA